MTTRRRFLTMLGLTAAAPVAAKAAPVKPAPVEPPPVPVVGPCGWQVVNTHSPYVSGLYSIDGVWFEPRPSRYWLPKIVAGTDINPGEFVAIDADGKARPVGGGE